MRQLIHRRFRAIRDALFAFALAGLLSTHLRLGEAAPGEQALARAARVHSPGTHAYTCTPGATRGAVAVAAGAGRDGSLGELKGHAERPLRMFGGAA